MASFWILGAGRFGSLAVEQLLVHYRGSSLVVVDRDKKVLEKMRDQPVESVVKGALEFLLHQPGCGSEWIVPAIPEHVAFKWLSMQLVMEGEVVTLDIPSTIEHQMPNPIYSTDGALCTSFATFRCPENCEAPEEGCIVTGAKRQDNLFDLIQKIQIEGYLTLVIRSHQLAPGVGGYQLSALWRLLENVRSTNKNILVATACRCHGIVNALRWARSTDR